MNLTIDGTIYPSQHFGAAFVYQSGNFLTLLRTFHILPNRRWGPRSSLYNGDRVVQGDQAAHPYLAPRLRKEQSYNSSHPSVCSWQVIRWRLTLITFTLRLGHELESTKILRNVSKYLPVDTLLFTLPTKSQLMAQMNNKNKHEEGTDMYEEDYVHLCTHTHTHTHTHIYIYTHIHIHTTYSYIHTWSWNFLPTNF